MANRLAGETSPYLLQHKDNPVDWYPWGEEALDRARTEQRPLLVSIGYSACHWCHVMERESFEDPETAAYMNASFVCIKVDREERPDVDAACMEACQAMTGQGGWPLNAFLTPEQAPFYVGTYFPPESRHGLPSWRAVLEAVARAWETQREEVRQSSLSVVKAIGASARLRAGSEPIEPGLLDQAVEGLRGSFDRAHGGFARAPKFPMGSVIEFLLGRGETTMSLGTLRAMASGGIYDQVGGGFARYAVDSTWTVPHFEKMLYDNALLARAYLHGHQVSGDAALRRTAEETLDWVLREMRGPEGGFYSALDADSEGVEGRFYVWSLPDLRAALRADADAAIDWFGATDQGNFEGANVLEARGPEPPPEVRERIRATLLAARAERVRPGTDDKRLCAWNALMIHALAEAGAALARRDYLDAAGTAADFVLGAMRDGDGGLLRTYKDGEAKIEGYLEDHAFLLQALLALYEATFEPRWFTEAQALADTIIDRFADAEHGGFFTTAADRPLGFARRKDLEDSPIPSGNSAAALGLLRLGRMTGDPRHAGAAQRTLELLAPLAARHPLAFGHALQALDFALSPVREVAIAGQGPAADTLAGLVRTAFAPRVVLAGGPPEGIALLDGRTPVDGRPAAYVCEHFTCQAPVTTPQALAAALGHPAG